MSDPDGLSAFDISELVLEITGEALMMADADRFAERFIVPQIVGTFEGDRMMQSREDLIETFFGVVGHLRSLGCDRLLRFTIAAEFDGPDTVVATFESHALNGNVKLRDPVLSHGKLRRDNGIWKVAESRYAVSNEPDLDNALMGRARNYRKDL